MSSPIFYVKSLEDDFFTKTLKGKRKVNFQSIKDMIHTKTIHPNTKSFGRVNRLSTTILAPTYLKTYRSQGIIFQTKSSPSYVLPCDLVILSDVEKMIVHYYRIKENLHFYYNHELIPGFEQFIFKDFTKLLKKFPNHNEVWKEINDFRLKAGYKKLPASKRRLIEYNEAVFEKSISIKPIAIFGYTPKAREIAKQLGLPFFKSAKDFYLKTTNSLS